MGVVLQLFVFFFLLPLKPAQSRAAVAPHPFYISNTEITQNTTAKTLEISCKFFADDFEQALESVYHTPLDIASPKSKAQFDNFIPDYINKHLLLAADGKRLKLNYIGFEKEKESVYCYFEVVNQPAVKQLDAVNSLLHDFQKEQINIMHVTIGGKRQSTKLDYPATEASFRF